jgi:hypothetical protein
MEYFSPSGERKRLLGFSWIRFIAKKQVFQEAAVNKLL